MSENALPVTDVAVVIGYKTKNGKKEEIVHTIDSDDVRIVTCSHTVEEKMKAAKDEEGNSLGFEPTGEYVLTLKVKFIKDR